MRGENLQERWLKPTFDVAIKLISVKPINKKPASSDIIKLETGLNFCGEIEGCGSSLPRLYFATFESLELFPIPW